MGLALKFATGENCPSPEPCLGSPVPGEPATQDQIRLERKLGTILLELGRHGGKNRPYYARSFSGDPGCNRGRTMERDWRPETCPHPRVGVGSDSKRPCLA